MTPHLSQTSGGAGSVPDFSAAATVGADAVIVDLEDSVTPAITGEQAKGFYVYAIRTSLAGRAVTNCSTSSPPASPAESSTELS
jgi:hypothetical protein